MPIYFQDFMLKDYSSLMILGVLLFTVIGCASLEGPEKLQLPEYSTQKPTHFPKLQSQNFDLSWPIRRARLTQKFRPAHNPKHEGIDLAASRGTPILAAHHGRVVFSGTRYSGYGRIVLLEFNNTWATLYAHLGKIFVKEGHWVQKGDVIATMGNSGNSTGVHLHFELSQNKQPLDPLAFL